MPMMVGAAWLMARGSGCCRRSTGYGAAVRKPFDDLIAAEGVMSGLLELERGGDLLKTARQSTR